MFLRTLKLLSYVPSGDSEGTQWFLAFKNENYLKTDAILLTSGEEILPVSIIFRRDNPYKYQIMEAFEKLTDGFTHK